MRKNNTTIQYLNNVLLPILLYSSITGIICGALISAFNYVSSVLSGISVGLYELVRANPAFIPVLFAALILLAFIMSLILHVVPEVTGSGIPRSEGVMRGFLRFKWYRILVNTIICSFISFFAGLPLGSEGPSIQLGMASASGISGIMKKRFVWKRYIVTGGAAAGLAVAFSAPITGIIFVLEEVHKQFNPMLLLTAMVSVTTGLATSKAMSLIWGGHTELFYWVKDLTAIPINLTWAMIIVGIIAGLAATGFNFLLVHIGRLKISQKIPRFWKLLAVFVITGISGLLLTDALGSGFTIIEKLLTVDLAWYTVLLLLAVKITLIVLVFDSGATGGLFIPMLAIGAMVGSLCGKGLILIGMSETYYNTIILLTMTAFLGACLRAPITALVLFVETSGAASGFLTSGIETFVAFIVAELLMRKPLYDVLLEREIKSSLEGKIVSNKSIDMSVETGSFAENKTIREIMWPVKCHIHTIVREEAEFSPDGKTILLSGDLLHIQCGDCDEKETVDDLEDLLKNQTPNKNDLSCHSV